MTLFSMKTLYAIQAVVLLARDDAASLSSRQLASRGALPLRYLEGILVELKRAGLVESLRGSGGGYRLCRPATEIQFIDVVEALEGPLQLVQPTEGHSGEFRHDHDAGSSGCCDRSADRCAYLHLHRRLGPGRQGLRAARRPFPYGWKAAG